MKTVPGNEKRVFEGMESAKQAPLLTHKEIDAWSESKIQQAQLPRIKLCRQQAGAESGRTSQIVVSSLDFYP